MSGLRQSARKQYGGQEVTMPIMQPILEDKPNLVDFTKSALCYGQEHIIMPTE
jgi:hypothetical protein